MHGSTVLGQLLSVLLDLGMQLQQGSPLRLDLGQVCLQVHIGRPGFGSCINSCLKRALRVRD